MAFEDGFPTPGPPPRGGEKRGEDRGGKGGERYDWTPFDPPDNFFDRGPIFPVITVRPPKPPPPPPPPPPPREETPVRNPRYETPIPPKPDRPGPGPQPPDPFPGYLPPPPFDYRYEPPYRGRDVPLPGSDADFEWPEYPFWSEYPPGAAPPAGPSPWVQTFAPGGDPFPEVLPNIVKSVPGVLGRVLVRVLGGVGWIFFPSRTADDDVWGPEMDPQPLPKGPPKRPKIGRPQPYGWPLPDFYNYARRRRPGLPGVLYPDVGDPFPDTGPATRPVDAPWTVPSPGTPVFNPTSTPAPTATPTRTPYPDLFPYLAPFLRPAPRAAPPRPQIRPPKFDPLTPPKNLPVDSPQPFGPPNTADPCNCAAQDTKNRKRKKDACTNPISSKRTFTRGGTRYRTITRKLQCRV